MIVLDLDMARRSPVAAKLSEAKPLFAVIVVLGATAIAEELMRLAVQPHISKPFDLEALLAAIESCFRPSGLTRG